jgi:hypothetical protein
MIILIKYKMKKLSIFLLLFVKLLSIKASAQSANSTNTSSINKSEIIGVWQVNNPIIGNGLSECFRFYPNGKFIYEYDPSDDTRNIIKLKGHYRLDDNQLFFTIISRIERVGGKIAAGAGGTDEYLFTFDNDKIKETIEQTPKELDPLFISKINRKLKQFNVYINNRRYYKVSANPEKFKD